MKRALTVAGVAAGVLVLAQPVPHGRHHENPPVQQEPAGNLPETRVLAQRACFDCHSNERNALAIVLSHCPGFMVDPEGCR